MISSFLLCIAAAYFVGSLPFGYLVGRIVSGEDIRKLGSGNIGATNVGRVLGAKWGMFVLVLDAFKGLLPVWGLPRLAMTPDDPDFLHLRVACALATIIGHIFPCWLGFRGGKGVATALGVVVILGPWASLAALVVFVATFALKRIVSLGSILAAVAFAVAQMILLWPEAFSKTTWSLGAFSLFVPALIIVRHRSNLGRLWRGEEPRFESKRRGANDPPAVE